MTGLARAATRLQAQLELAVRPRPRRGDTPPRFDVVQSQPCTQLQMLSPEYQLWAERLGETAQLQRRQWEWFFVLQSLRQAGSIRAGALGIGIGSDPNPIARYLAAQGCAITTTHDPARAFASCDGQLMDFVWSVSVLDELAVDRGRALVESSLDVLRDGGVTVHTVSYAVRPDITRSIRPRPVTAYRKRDLVALERDLRAEGHQMRCTFVLGDLPADRWIDRPPYSPTHVVAQTGAGVVTSFGVLIQKAGDAR